MSIVKKVKQSTPVSNICLQNNNSLQKFTDFEGIKTKEGILKLKAEQPENYEQFSTWVIEKLNEAHKRVNKDYGAVDKYFDLLELYYEVERPSALPGSKRDRWELNKHKIENAIHNDLLTYNRLPTHIEICNATGLSRVTVSKHLKDGAGSDLQKGEIENYKLMTGNVLQALYRIGMKNENVKALKVYLDYFKETTPIRQQNNYLQINSTRIDEGIVNQLPNSARQQIENIIKEFQPLN